jgi:hypothetical protein
MYFISGREEQMKKIDVDELEMIQAKPKVGVGGTALRLFVIE